MVESVRIEGLNELMAKLKDLPEKIARNALRVSTYAGARVILSLHSQESRTRSASFGPCARLRRSVNILDSAGDASRFL